MRIIDITQELFQAPVYPGDPVPDKKAFMDMNKGDVCNLTILTMGSHGGTHLDAPRHFYKEGKNVDEIALEKCVGACKVISHQGKVTAEHIASAMEDGTRRLLIKGEIEITPQAASEAALRGLYLLGVEGQTVGISDTQIEIHHLLLGSEVVILEGLVLTQALDKQYMLSAAPLKMAGLDGSPVRAVLMDIE